MPSTPNYPAMRSHLESQIGFMTELTRHTYDSVRKLSEINLRLAQQLIEDGVDTGRKLLSCSDPVQMSAMAMGQLQPLTQHLRNYQQQLMSILSGAQADLTRTAQAHLPDTSRSASAAAEELARRSAELTQAFTRQHQGNGSAARLRNPDGTAGGQGSANGVHHTPG